MTVRPPYCQQEPFMCKWPVCACHELSSEKPQSDTPRTDAVVIGEQNQFVPADFARQLERKLAELDQRYHDMLQEAGERIATVLAERNAARSATGRSAVIEECASNLDALGSPYGDTIRSLDRRTKT